VWSGNRCRGQRQQLHSWAYAQLRDFVTYKAASVGVPVEVINPRNTSRTCYPCGHIAYLGYVKYMTTTHGYWAA